MFSTGGCILEVFHPVAVTQATHFYELPSLDSVDWIPSTDLLWKSILKLWLQTRQ